MDTIKNYLETMFASMPNTPEVQKAKDELLSMMEDKYNELIAEGQSENAAVGTVMSEFGNLDELAEDLGLAKEVEEVHVREQEVSRRFVSLQEVQSYLDNVRTRGLLIGIGVLLCITCVVPPQLADMTLIGGGFHVNEAFGVVGMLAFLAVAIGLFIFSGVVNHDFDYIKKEPCQIDYTTANLIGEKRKDFRITRAWMLTVGVIMCAFCWVPAAVVDNDGTSILLFLLVGLGVFLIIFSSTIDGGYEDILNVNDRTTMSGKYGRDDEIEYVSPAATIVMSVYWTTITCIYLAISFLTFQWGVTWIIWPVAGIIHKILQTTLAKEV